MELQDACHSCGWKRKYTSGFPLLLHIVYEKLFLPSLPKQKKKKKGIRYGQTIHHTALFATNENFSDVRGDDFLFYILGQFIEGNHHTLVPLFVWYSSKMLEPTGQI